MARIRRQNLAGPPDTTQMRGARVAVACDEVQCGHMLVRGDQIEFISVEQARRVGCSPTSCPTALSESRMPSDIVLPPEFVLVHDTSGEVFDRCELHVVRWRSSRGARLQNLSGRALDDAVEYFGGSQNFRMGSVELPKGPWRKVCDVQLVRYRRPGFKKGFEHLWDPPVVLSACERPLAWKLSLPDRCVIDERGFVRP